MRTSTSTWRVVPMSGGSRTITHGVIAVAPGCPTDRHPTRDCGCTVFRTRKAAEAHIASRGGVDIHCRDLNGETR